MTSRRRVAVPPIAPSTRVGSPPTAPREVHAGSSRRPSAPAARGRSRSGCSSGSSLKYENELDRRSARRAVPTRPARGPPPTAGWSRYMNASISCTPARSPRRPCARPPRRSGRSASRTGRASRPSSAQRPLRVEVVGQRDVDGIDVRVREQRLVRIVRAGDRRARLRRAGSRRRHRRDAMADEPAARSAGARRTPGIHFARRDRRRGQDAQRRRLRATDATLERADGRAPASGLGAWVILTPPPAM